MLAGEQARELIRPPASSPRGAADCEACNILPGGEHLGMDAELARSRFDPLSDAACQILVGLFHCADALDMGTDLRVCVGPRERLPNGGAPAPRKTTGNG